MSSLLLNLSSCFCFYCPHLNFPKSSKEEKKQGFIRPSSEEKRLCNPAKLSSHAAIPTGEIPLIPPFGGISPIFTLMTKTARLTQVGGKK